MRLRALFAVLLFLLLDSCAAPYGIYHRVREGETLRSLSVRYQVDLDKLRAANTLGPADEVKPGDYLFIPGVKAPYGETTMGALSQPKKAESTLGKTGTAALATTHGEAGKDLTATDGARFIWPVRGVVTSLFGMRGSSSHEGIDIGVPEGTPVVAAGDGKVIFAADHGAYGNVVIIQHTDNYFTVYAHNSKLLVQEGQTVKAGEKIALSGSTGRSSGPHLHFEVRIGAKPQDPMQFLPRAAP